MTPALAAIYGTLDQPRRELAGPDALNAPLVLLRAQSVSRATVSGAAGWAEAGANVARFAGSPGRLLVEGQRSNEIANPRAEFAVAPSFPQTTLPSSWTAIGGTGLTVQAVAAGTASGLRYVDIRFVGTPSGTNVDIAFNGTAASGPSSGIVTLSVLAALVGGALTNIGGVSLLLQGQSGSGTVALSGSLLRYAYSATLTGQRSPRLRLTLTAGLAVDATIRLAAPQYETGPFASTPILPVTGSPQAATRGADLVSAALESLGIGPGGACTLLWSGVLPQAAPSGTPQVILQIDDGTAANGFVLLNEGGGTQVVARRILAGAASDAVLGAMTAGAALRLGMAVDGAGRLAASLNGGAAVAVTGGPTGGLLTLRLGSGAAGDRAMFGETTTLRCQVGAVADSALPGLVAALP